jgi:hypothetical protein
MTDEMIKQEKYKCEIQSGIEGLEIADLFIKIGALQKHVVIQQGEYLPIDLVEFDNLKKSRLVGSLKRCIDYGWVSVESPTAVPPKVKEVAVSKPAARPVAITEEGAGIVSARDITNKVSDMRRVDADTVYPDEIQPPVREIVTVAQSKTPNAMAITETTVAADGYFAFEKLKYFQKLKTIKDSSDVTLLKAIIEKSPYPQLVHNAQVRMQELELASAKPV